MTILVTRPSPAGEQLVTRLRALGRVAYHAPLIDFSPGRDLPKLPELLQDMQAGDLVFALSQNAVRYANPLLKRNKTVMACAVILLCYWPYNRISTAYRQPFACHFPTNGGDQ